MRYAIPLTARGEAMSCRAIVRWALFLSLVFVLAAGCAPRVKPPCVSRPQEAMEEISSRLVPLEKDDLNRSSLEEAIRNSLRYYEALPEETHLAFGRERVPLLRAKRSLEVFLSLLAESRSWEELAKRVRQKFIMYRSAGTDGEGRVLFTGYYEPTLQGSLTPDEYYRFPIYGVPDDLVHIELGRFRPEFQGMRLVGRCEFGRVIPYYSRKEIDSGGVLAGRGLELVWVADPVAKFFLEIQGSGRVRLLNGEYVRLRYAASNGRPYRSIGRLLIEKELLPKQVMSMQAIRCYLRRHPEEMDEIFNHNPSYVFFRTTTEGPFGSICVPITAGRSIATDAGLFPRGALAFIECKKPIFARDGVIMGWKSFGRYVLNQDSGGAIRGPGRADLFWGNGPLSRIAAGHLKHYGTLYFLLLKE
ncbi:MAG: murein transglycosylase A [Syntrophobacteria bacterium]